MYKNILHLGKYYPPYKGGMELVLEQMVKGLSQKYHLSVLVANTSLKTERSYYEQIGFDLIRVSSLGTVLSTSICPMYPFELKRIKYDLVHLHLPNPLAELSYLISGLKRENLILQHHSDIVKQKVAAKVYHPFLEHIYKKANKIIVPTPNHIKISEYLKKNEKKISIIPFGIDLKNYELTDEKKTLLNKTFIKKRPVILFVGRLVYYKDLKTLIKAINKLDADLWVVGEGPLSQELKTYCIEMGLDDKVKFWGKLNHTDLLAKYYLCDIFVLPSNSYAEMFGMVQLEAMAFSKPIITSDIPTGVTWVNQNEITGLHFRTNDSDDLRDKIEYLLKNDTRREEMGKNGKRTLENNFTLDIMIDKIDKLYKTF